MHIAHRFGSQGWLDEQHTTNYIGASLFELELGYRPNGTINSQTWRQAESENPGVYMNYTYSYDKASRLTNANFSGSGYNSDAFDVRNLYYDKNGNLTQYLRNNQQGNTGPDATGYIEIHIASESNRIDFLRNGALYDIYETGYDANGNMTENELNGLETADYDWRNLPYSLTANGSTISYSYDGNARRVRKQAGSIQTHYIRGADGQTLAVYEDGDLAFHNLLAAGEIIGTHDGSDRHYFVKDHLGSVRTVVNENGNAVEYDDYYPFGLLMPGRSSNFGNPNDDYKFTGHELDDEAGLDIYYMGARYMDPALGGRFYSIDPLAREFPNISPYAYGNNNPLRYTDPTGMAPEECPPCGGDLLGQLKYIFSLDNTYVGELARADQQGRLEEKVSQDLNDAGNATVDYISQKADEVSDASTLLGAGGIVVAGAGAAVTVLSEGAASPLGASLMSTGIGMMEASVAIGSTADAVSTVSKGVDAAAFDGSSSAFYTQLGKTGLNALGGAALKSTGGALVRVNSAGKFFNPASGRFVTNQYGRAVTAARDATNVVTAAGLGQLQKLIDNQ